jgi:hypothetical protein
MSFDAYQAEVESRDYKEMVLKLANASSNATQTFTRLGFEIEVVAYEDQADPFNAFTEV